MPEISIIVPVYNVEKYLSKCIDSILNQTFNNFELILVDDGSTDKSYEICDYYKNIDRRVVVIHKNNEGAAEARNYGIRLAKGDFIGFVDSDDYIEENMYETLYNIMIDFKSDIVVCNHMNFKDNFYKRENKRIMKKDIKSFNNIEALENYLLNYGDKNKVMKTIVWDKLYKKELFDNISFPKGKIAEDGYVIYKLLYYSNKITYVDEILYYYYQRNDSVSKTKFSLKTLEVYDDWREIFLFLYSKNKKLSKKAAKYYIDKHISTYKKLMNNEYKLEVYKKYKDLIRDDFKNDFLKFKNIKLSKLELMKVYLFTINYYLFEIFENILYYVKCIKNKIKNIIIN